MPAIFRIMALACFAAFLIAQHAPALAGLSLCIGESGHFEIESTEAVCCPLQCAAPSEATLLPGSDECAACIDVGLGQQDRQPASVKPAFSGKLILPLSQWLGLRLPLPPAHNALAGLEGSGTPSPAIARSVVLRV